MTEVEALYAWDSARAGNRFFDTFSWYRQGEAIMTMARDWVLAPHRRACLLEVVGTLVVAKPDFAAGLKAATDHWPVPSTEKERLEQRLLKSSFDPANWKSIVDQATVETGLHLDYPAEVRADVTAYQRQASMALQPLTLPYQCEKILAGSADVEEESADYLATLLPKTDAELVHATERLPMIAAAAATLIARGGDWKKHNPAAVARSVDVVRAVIAYVDTLKPDRDDHHAEEALRFAARGALYAALDTSQPSSWDATLITALTADHGNALNVLMSLAERHRAELGPAWYRLNFVLLLFAGLERLSPRYGEEEDLGGRWRRRLERLRRQPVFGTKATLKIIDPTDIARRAERLLERRQERKHPDRPRRLSGKARRFAGLSTFVLDRGFAWLLDHERAESNASEAQNHQLLSDLWACESWRMEGERDGDPLDPDEDEEYDLPSHMGYAILRVAPAFVLHPAAPDPDRLWRDILAIGPNGYHAMEQFASTWFLTLFSPVDADRFMATWTKMLLFAFDAKWQDHRRWYRGRDMLTHLLGLHAHSELSQAEAILHRLSDLMKFYCRWASEVMPQDDDDLATFCFFLTKDAGRSLRLDGIVWIAESLKNREELRRSETRNNVAEAVDTILTHHSAELLKRAEARVAVIEITAYLVGSEVATAMNLQRRIAALR